MSFPLLPIRIIEAPGSRSSARGRNPEDGYKFIVTGVTLEWTARVMLDNYTPLTLGSEPMWKQSVEVQERAGTFGVWDGIVKYGPIKLPQAGDWTWDFDCTVETQHITHAKEHIADYAASGGTAKDHKGAIGVSQDGSVEGVDIYHPKFEWCEKHLIAYTNANDAWMLSMALTSLGAHTNASTFRNFAPGTVLFLGATGGRSNTRPSLFEVNCRFRANYNETNIAVDNITISSKKAWEYVWMESGAEVTDASAGMIQKPIGAHVERVYDSGDFSILGIPQGGPTY